MATPFSDVYAFFTSKISDYSFLKLTQIELEDNLENYLNSASVKFRRCKKDLSDKDKTNNQFNIDLSDEEKEILATLMTVEYLSPKLITSDLLQQTLGTKDYRLYSQANHIKEIKDLRNVFKSEANQLMMDYSYFHGSLDGLK
jgi:hypothetical protein